MDDQKIENLLNLSLQADQQEREKSLVLEEGYVPQNRQWELIVKYSGDFTPLYPFVVRATLLLNEYAIVLIEESRIDAFSQMQQVEYIEKPKRLFFAVESAKRVSCIPPVQREPLSLTGRGVLVAVLDSGIDIFNRDFQHPDGSTRIVALWDQVLPGEDGRGAEEYFDGQTGLPGRIFLEEELNAILRKESSEEEIRIDGMPYYSGIGRAGRGVIPGEDRSGHGTAVCGIAAGNGANSGGRNRGVAYESPIVAVKLGAPDPEGFPRTTQLMLAADFAVRVALRQGLPVVINLSFGNAYGPHDATSLLERYLDDLSNYGRTVIVAGSGNEGAAAGHTELTLRQGEVQTVRLAVGAFTPGLNVQIWKQYVDDLDITIVAPAGQQFVIPVRQPGAHRVRLARTDLLLFVGEPGPYSVDQEIFVDFLPVGGYVDVGEWNFVIRGVRIVVGRVNLWLPGGGIIGTDTRFLNPTPELTLTIPSTAQRLITVGAYDSLRDAAADFSGRGGMRLAKPDLAAPGVDIVAPAPGNGYLVYSGTSMAAPFVAGSAALLMQWGITDGNDPYLYGEKVRAYLQKGARQLPAFARYPNPQVGYGALCVRDSFPE